MTGGLIRVMGDSGALAGNNLKGGEIIVEGDAGEDAGERMTGGVLRVMGKIRSLGDPKGGRIYAGGKLVFSAPGISSKKHLAKMADVDDLNEYLRATEGDADG
jgi:formylmethanofuran dehydrogenase subunit C